MKLSSFVTEKTPLKAMREAAGRWWALATVAPFIGLQTVAYELFGDNEQLKDDITSAAGMTLVGAVVLGWTAKRLHMPTEIARFAVPAGAALGGAALELYGQDRLHFDGIQSGILATPVGEAAVLAGTVAAAGVFGEATGRALVAPAERRAPAST